MVDPNRVFRAGRFESFHLSYPVIRRRKEGKKERRLKSMIKV